MQYYYEQPMMNGGNFGGGWGIFMMLFWLASVIIFGLVIVRVLRHYRGDTHHKVDHFDIIKERYARGDITQEQFEQLKKDLK